MSEPPRASSAQPVDSPEVLARIRDGMQLIEYIAAAMRRELGSATLSLEDMRSYGREALVRAARSFDPTRGVPFPRWAQIRIRGAIIDGVRSERMPRRLYEKLRALEAANDVQEGMLEADAASPPKTAQAADDRLGSYLASMASALAVGLVVRRANEDLDRYQHPSISPEEALEQRQLTEAVRESIAERPEAERHLLERYYVDGTTLEEAARELGLSKSWASRLHARAIEGLTKDLKKKRALG